MKKIIKGNERESNNREIYICWVSWSYCCHDETPWPKVSWKGKCLFDLHFHVTVHHWRKSGQELRQDPGGRSRCRGHGGVLLTGLLSRACSACFLRAHRTQSPAVALTSVSQAFPHQSSLEKVHHWFSHRFIWWGHFFNWDFFFSND